MPKALGQPLRNDREEHHHYANCNRAKTSPKAPQSLNFCSTGAKEGGILATMIKTGVVQALGKTWWCGGWTILCRTLGATQIGSGNRLAAGLTAPD